MRILFVADGRSPTTLNWLRHWVAAGHEVHLVSTFPGEAPEGLESFHVLPVAFAGMAGGQAAGIKDVKRRPGLMNRLRGPLRLVRYYLGPISLSACQRRFRVLLADIRPDLVHALRIPFEGMLAAVTPSETPLLISIWGNDLTLHARGSFLMAAQTRRVLGRADGLLADTARDLRLGSEWGFATGKRTLVVPGGGGIRLDEIEAISSSGVLPEALPEGPLVVNPRGQRPGSLRQDVFFRAIPLVLEKVPQAVFVCPPLLGDADAEGWVSRLGIQAQVRLWGRLESAQLWTLFKKAQVYVSPSVHDGTPNSLLEAMACGCFPVVGDVESLCEWVRPGINGLLADATSPRSLAEAIVTALENPALRAEAKKENARLITEHAEYGHCMAMVEAFYREIIASRGF